ncbi:hypothetical protein DFP73DRAFT_582848 [Morchella snyderi]|nr:hypothetical protein DFP73DRAFT_582848 [Morchella snyderi]
MKTSSPRGSGIPMPLSWGFIHRLPSPSSPLRFSCFCGPLDSLHTPAVSGGWAAVAEDCVGAGGIWNMCRRPWLWILCGWAGPEQVLDGAYSGSPMYKVGLLMLDTPCSQEEEPEASFPTTGSRISVIRYSGTVATILPSHWVDEKAPLRSAENVYPCKGDQRCLSGAPTGVAVKRREYPPDINGHPELSRHHPKGTLVVALGRNEPTARWQLGLASCLPGRPRLAHLVWCFTVADLRSLPGDVYDSVAHALRSAVSAVPASPLAH